MADISLSSYDKLIGLYSDWVKVMKEKLKNSRNPEVLKHINAAQAILEGKINAIDKQAYIDIKKSAKDLFGPKEIRLSDELIADVFGMSKRALERRIRKQK